MPQGAARRRSTLSLRARALKLLARREYSRLELRQRLLAHADSDAELEAVLDECVQRRWQSDDRFAQVFVDGRAARFGSMRLRHELAERGIDAERIDAAVGALGESELERGHAVWARRFDAAPADLRERARQTRFLAQRGFSAAVIRQILRRAGKAPEDTS